MPFATMPKTLVFAVFLPLCTTFCTRRGGVVIQSACLNTGIYSVFASFCNILDKEAEQDTLPQVSMNFATMPKNTGICGVFASLYNTLHQEGGEGGGGGIITSFILHA